ncbi:MAG: glycine cleavage system aminomethyltransferase GcvT [Firmicutes bacterium]|nr:glycine cleavage system aminomethyltransferase GcvT [Bacillota bacterium]
MAGRVTPLVDHHRALGARFTEFGGWEMPVQYTGIIDEHLVVRQACGLFDLSHMGEVEIKGPLALEFAQWVLTNDITKVAPGRVQYSLLCNEAGGIIDDLLVYRHLDYVTLAVNASNTTKDVEWLLQQASQPPYQGKVEIANVGETRAILAVQGPMAPKVMEAVGLEVLDLPYMAFCLLGDKGELMISRTGYTGELGYELYMPAADAPLWWTRFMSLAEPMGLKPVGLGARDTLRLEMGYTLYGNDIDESTTPWEAGLGWAVKLDKDFIGREALAACKDKTSRRLVGFMLQDRGIARRGYTIQASGQPVGEVASGCMSPSLGRAIGLAYVDIPWAKVGTPIEIVIRGKAVAAEIASLPFVPSRVKDTVSKSTENQD